MRLVTPGDSAPASIHRYLLPDEQQVITVRRHPAILMTPIAFVLGGLIVAGVLSNVLSTSMDWVWWGGLAPLAWFVWEGAEGSGGYFLIPNKSQLFTPRLLTP